MHRAGGRVALLVTVLVLLAGLITLPAENGDGADGASCSPPAARSCCRQCDWDVALCRQDSGHDLLDHLSRAASDRAKVAEFDLRGDQLSSVASWAAAGARAVAECDAVAFECRRDCDIATDRNMRCVAACGRTFACVPPVRRVPFGCLRACRRTAAIQTAAQSGGTSSSAAIRSAVILYGACSHACRRLAEEERSVTGLRVAARSICRDEWRSCVLRCEKLPRDDP